MGWWIGGGYVLGTLAVLAWCRSAARRDAAMARRHAINVGIARAEWWANAREWERLDQVLTGSEPWLARRGR